MKRSTGMAGIAIALTLAALWVGVMTESRPDPVAAAPAPAGSGQVADPGESRPGPQPGPGPTRGVVADPAAAAPAEAGPTMRDLLVRVIDARGTPISAARVHFDDGSVEEFLGLTDASGNLSTEVPAAWNERQSILATREGFAPRQAPLSRASAESATLVLSPAGTIRGHVQWLTGQPCGAGVAVYAYPTEETLPSDASLQRYLRGAAASAKTATEPDGRFELSELDTTRTYTLFGALQGCMTRNAPAGVSVGSDSVQLELGVLFGVRFAYVDAQTDEHARIPAALLQPESAKLRFHSVGGSVLPFHPSWTRLCGVESDSSSEYRSDQPTFFFVGAPDQAQIGPIAYSVDLPGYRQVQGECMALPVGESVLEHRVLLEPLRVGAERGLRVEFRGLPPGLPATRFPAVPEGLLVAHTSRGKMVFGLSRLGPAPVDLEGVPAGELQWRVAPYSSAGEFNYEGGVLGAGVDDADSRDTVVADLSESGALLIALTQVDGSPYTGPARFRFDRLNELGERQLAQLVYERSPFAAVALSAGEYAVNLTTPKPSDPSELRVSVVAGQLARMEILIR